MVVVVDVDVVELDELDELELVVVVVVLEEELVAPGDVVCVELVDDELDEVL